MQKATAKPDDENKPKRGKVSQKPKYEELPEIPDYERPQLEKYEKIDLDPKSKVSNDAT